jgi:hypothetical protein
MFSHVLYYVNKSIASQVRYYHQFKFIDQFHFVCGMDKGFSEILVQDPDVDFALPNGNDIEDEPADLRCEAMQDESAVKKMPPKPRKPHQLTNDPFIISRVDDKGVLVCPLKAASGYRNAIGVIVRETVNITCTSLRVEEQANIREEIFKQAIQPILLQLRW